MYVYVIAASKEGPCKVGKANDPEKRLRTLQTGHPHALALCHVEPIGTAASVVERAVQHALKLKKTGGGEEWFEITPEEARLVIRAAASATNTFLDDSLSLHEMSKRAALRWLRDIGKLRDKHGDEYVEELEQTSPPSVAQVIAGSLRPPKMKNFDFNDYLLTWEEGMWLRWGFENSTGRLPPGTRLDPYLAMCASLQRDEDPSLRWIEWSAARELKNDEVTFLCSVWDQFVPKHNLIEAEGPQLAAAGIDDHVDDVHLFTLERNRERGDCDCLVFWHKSFRAVVFPPPKMRFSEFKGLTLALKTVGNVAASGFVAPVFESSDWTMPFGPWLQSAPKTRDADFEKFLASPQKRFPSQRPYDGAHAATNVVVALPSIDKYGLY